MCLNRASMKILVVGTGGVGAAVAAVARRRRFFERMILADLAPERPQRLVASLDDERFTAAAVDASDEAALAELIRASGADAVLNATDPRFNPPIFAAAGATGATGARGPAGTHGANGATGSTGLPCRSWRARPEATASM